MKASVIGAAGLLGHTLYRRWSARPGWEVAGADIRPPLPSVRRLDLLDRKAAAAWIRETSPDALVMAAAVSHVDYCESHPDETRRLNVEATLAAARAARESGAKAVFISSDYVFDGFKAPYRETDGTAPLNEYGRQKLEVERALSEFGEDALVVRVTALFGWELDPRNYVLQVLRKLRAGERVRAARDQDYNPTPVEGLQEALAGLLERGCSGVYHLVGSELMSRLQLARAVAAAFGLDEGLIEGVRFDELDMSGRAPRPLHTGLDATRAERLLGRKVQGASEGLERMRSAEDEWRAYAAGLSKGGRP